MEYLSIESSSCHIEMDFNGKNFQICARYISLLSYEIKNMFS